MTNNSRTAAGGGAAREAGLAGAGTNHHTAAFFADGTGGDKDGGAVSRVSGVPMERVGIRRRNSGVNGFVG